jgi:hypothetical protein
MCRIGPETTRHPFVSMASTDSVGPDAVVAEIGRGQFALADPVPDALLRHVEFTRDVGNLEPGVERGRFFPCHPSAFSRFATRTLLTVALTSST